MGEEMVSRRAVRHLLQRRRNERIAELRDDRRPVALAMHPDTLAELLIDGDPAERWTLDFEGLRFAGVPIVDDGRLAPGEFVVHWPPAAVRRG